MQGSSGYQPITLREYQEEMLKSYVENRFSITLASRQVGKCSINSYINILDKNETCKKTINELYMENTKKTFLSKLKNYLYKLYQKL